MQFLVGRVMSSRGQFSATYLYLRGLVQAWNSKDGDEILQDTAVNKMDVLGSIRQNPFVTTEKQTVSNM